MALLSRRVYRGGQILLALVFCHPSLIILSAIASCSCIIYSLRIIALLANSARLTLAESISVGFTVSSA